VNEVSDAEQHIEIDPRRESELEYWAKRLDVPKDGGFTSAGPTS
jgi:hypothetical protein